MGLSGRNVDACRPAASPALIRCPVVPASLVYSVNLGLTRLGDCGRKEVGRYRLKNGASLLKQPRSPKHTVDPREIRELDNQRRGNQRLW